VTTATLRFDAPDATYTEGDPITFTVEVDANMDAQVKDVTFTGSVAVPGLGSFEASGTAHVTIPGGRYGAFSAPGYVVLQDPDNPAMFHATPAG
jgi:hypothetical protein